MAGRKKIQFWLVALALTLLAGCASGPKQISHTFTFDGWRDGWARQVDLLEYSYGDQYSMVHRKNHAGLGYGTGVNAAMPVADFLYVKWRSKATDEVIEDRVDLRGRLPVDMFMQTVTFVIDGKQLYVYVGTREEVKRRIEDADRPQRTWLSLFRIAYEIYPIDTQQQK